MADQKTIRTLQYLAIGFAGAFIVFKIASAIGGANTLASIRTQVGEVAKNVPGGLVIVNLCLDNLIAIAVILLAISVKMQDEKFGFGKEGMVGGTMEKGKCMVAGKESRSATGVFAKLSPPREPNGRTVIALSAAAASAACCSGCADSNGFGGWECRACDP